MSVNMSFSNKLKRAPKVWQITGLLFCFQRSRAGRETKTHDLLKTAQSPVSVDP